MHSVERISQANVLLFFWDSNKTLFTQTGSGKMWSTDCDFPISSFHQWRTGTNTQKRRECNSLSGKSPSEAQVF